MKLNLNTLVKTLLVVLSCLATQGVKWIIAAKCQDNVHWSTHLVTICCNTALTHLINHGLTWLYSMYWLLPRVLQYCLHSFSFTLAYWNSTWQHWRGDGERKKVTGSTFVTECIGYVILLGGNHPNNGYLWLNYIA